MKSAKENGQDKRADLALRYTSYTPETNPAFCALIEFAAQRPGIEPSGFERTSDYAKETQRISRLWQDIRWLVQACRHYNVREGELLGLMHRVNDGRLCYDGEQWMFTPQRNFSLEYRDAVVTLLRSCLPTHDALSHEDGCTATK